MYDEFTRDFKVNDEMIKNVATLKAELEEHRMSKECTKTPSCPICRDFDEKIIAAKPNLT